ncbi:MAG: hypothetical protein Q7O04_03280 [Candidatus Omnitrophota bacterium]|nr:hypothetical protein [Candidatus Omnitrophota bacterium]
MDKVKYYINPDNEFVIENYHEAGAFSNFLPGIAGLFGIPMWVFYVNRGQGICSFGVKGKDSSMMEFLPANRAYQLATLQGFRTFIKIKNKKSPIFYEPFQPHSQHRFHSTGQKMIIGSHELRIQETNPELGLQIGVEYFTIPNEPFAGLARIVTIKNISKKNVSLDMLDGTPLIIPYGTANFFLQKMRRTIEAWMLVENLEKNAPFYRLKVDPKDVSEVVFIKEGNFYIASSSQGKAKCEALPVIVDPEIIFGQITDFTYPVNFVKAKGCGFSRRQMAQNKLPCAMACASVELKPGKEFKLYSLVGHMSSKEDLNASMRGLRDEVFFIAKREENKNLIKGLEDNIFTASSDEKYDRYCGQVFLDNVLRGGFPIVCSNHYSRVFYVYSRKHGDLERDYNRFLLEPNYFSQGDGNFRDTNQNRRNDVFFNPEIKDFNILYFYGLQQADGYNPLILKGLRFALKEGVHLKDSLSGKVEEKDIDRIKPLVSIGFTPGRLFMDMERLGIKLKTGWHDFLQALSGNCVAMYDAEHGEGFWIDHWTYNLDLVESFLKVYPERLKEILLDKKEFTFYDNSFCVKPRSERYLLVREGVVRQYHSLEKDSGKEGVIRKREREPHVVRGRNTEEIYRTTLLVKMLCLAGNKIASLDASGIGIEMEADKPGWCDSMNGLPGLCGSSTPEVFELKRQVVFMQESIDKLGLGESYKLSLPEELYDLLKNIESLIKERRSDFFYWDEANSVKEEYRQKIKSGFSGIERAFSAKELKEIMDIFLFKIDSAVKKAYDPAKGAYTTYFINEVTKYEPLNRVDPVKGVSLVKPTAFKSIRLPLFLEGPVRALKVEGDPEKAKALYKSLKKTKIYDVKLKMYKINEPLGDVSKEIGRSSIFTPGWLENESIFLHMEYKYLLEILKKGLYEEFFEDFKNALIPFQKPERYGRSIFENSSFIVSSVFPDAKMRGKGFVARLSGSTAEMLNIWLLMSAGKEPFFVNEKGKLNLRFNPMLPSWLFTRKPAKGFPKNTYAFKFLGKTLIVYHNPMMKDTVGKSSARACSMTIEYDDGRKVDIQQGIIGSPYASDIRDRKVKRIDINLA